MDCWRSKTNEKFWGSLKCAGEAAALATGLSLKNKIETLVKSGKEVSKSLQNAKTLAGNAGDLAESVTDLSSFTDPTFWLGMGNSIAGDFELQQKK